MTDSNSLHIAARSRYIALATWCFSPGHLSNEKLRVVGCRWYWRTCPGSATDCGKILQYGSWQLCSQEQQRQALLTNLDGRAGNVFGGRLPCLSQQSQRCAPSPRAPTGRKDQRGTFGWLRMSSLGPKTSQAQSLRHCLQLSSSGRWPRVPGLPGSASSCTSPRLAPKLPDQSRQATPQLNCLARSWSLQRA